MGKKKKKLCVIGTGPVCCVILGTLCNLSELQVLIYKMVVSTTTAKGCYKDRCWHICKVLINGT